MCGSVDGSLPDRVEDGSAAGMWISLRTCDRGLGGSNESLSLVQYWLHAVKNHPLFNLCPEVFPEAPLGLIQDCRQDCRSFPQTTDDQRVLPGSHYATERADWCTSGRAGFAFTLRCMLMNLHTSTKSGSTNALHDHAVCQTLQSTYLSMSGFSLTCVHAPAGERVGVCVYVFVYIHMHFHVCD